MGTPGKYREERAGGASFALVVVLLALAAGLLCHRAGLLSRLAKDRRPETDARVGYRPVADVDASAFRAYAENMTEAAPIALSIGRKSDRFTVTRQTAAVDARAFRVKPEQYFQFVSADIDTLVKKGLTTTDLDGEPCKPFHGAPKIARDAADRSWVVTVPAIAGEGVIALEINGSRAEHRVTRPALFPIWKFAQYALPATSPDGRGQAFFQGCTVMERDRSRDSDKDCSVIAGNKAANLCGYRLHGVSERCVWLEVVYYSPVRAIKRAEWPDLSVVYRIVDGSAAPPVVRFADGAEMREGRRELDGGEALVLSPGGILGDNAVLFSYVGADGAKVADMVCVDLLAAPF